jgi:Rha family phage regulatory protein
MKTKELVYRNDIGNIVTTSLMVAEKYGKDHISVLNTINRMIEEENKELEEYELDAEYGELWKYFEKSGYTDDEGRMFVIYEITQDGFEILVDEYEDLIMKEVFIKEFKKLHPPLFRYQQEITDVKQVEAVLCKFDSNTEDDRQFKKAAFNELNFRARIIRLLQTEISELKVKLDIYNPKTLLDHVN